MGKTKDNKQIRDTTRPNRRPNSPSTYSPSSTQSHRAHTYACTRTLYASRLCECECVFSYSSSCQLPYCVYCVFFVLNNWWLVSTHWSTHNSYACYADNKKYTTGNAKSRKKEAKEKNRKIHTLTRTHNLFKKK